MKKTFLKSLVAVFCAVAFVLIPPLFISAPVLLTGCQTTGSGTNQVTTIDPAKLELVKAGVSAAASDVFRRAIKRSPEHAAEISAYVRGVGTAFCGIKARGTFSPDDVVKAVDSATQKLQAGAPDDVITGKNLLLLLYRGLYDDKLTVTVPGDQWPAAVIDVICSSINQVLTDSGQPGV